MKRKKIIISLLAVLMLVCGTSNLRADNAATMYFMEEIAERNNMNPAFMPNTKFYMDFIFLPNFYFEAGLPLTLREVINSKNGQTTTAFDSEESINKFIRGLKPSLTLNTQFNLNILSFGFQIKQNHYVTFDMGLNMEAEAFVPKDLLRFALVGTPDRNNVNTFDLSTLGVNANVYSFVGLGYMNRINNQWTVGVKAKFLMGYANASTNINKLELNASKENWTLASKGHFNASLPMHLTRDEEGNINGASLNEDDILKGKLFLHPAGYGAAFDLGFTYKPIEALTVSAAVTDLGFIHWNRNIMHGSMEGSHVFDGILDYTVGDSLSVDDMTQKLEDLGQEVLNSMDIDENGKPYTSMIRGNFTVGAEYGILKNKISFGAVNRMRFNATRVSDEVTIAVNFRPADWFKVALSHSFVNGNFRTLGLGLNLRLGMFNMYLITDYIPLTWTSFSSTDPESGKISSFPAPNALSRLNVQAGWTWNIGRHSNDRDNDGVYKRRDHCPDTDMDFLRKQCPGLKKKEYVDKYGCEYDEDGDGIHDCYDRCPETPAGVEVDEWGCPVDNDGDGIPDYLDKCPDTPEGVEVDENGCPVDGDGDGVPDYLDKCPDTPANVVVDEEGCPVDSDGDGVADYLDKCPDTPEGIEVDENGCPLDADGDGVPDYIDKCPDTPRNIAVDENGCPLDSDGDGIPDSEDKCPNQPGPASNYGCPELKKEVRNLFKKAMNGIQFETGKDIIKKQSYPILDQIVAVMELNSEYNLSIFGHTDNVGDPKKNLVLSQKRAEAVRQYLIKKGIDENRLVSEGFGDTKPIADNKTSKGRAQNRRVEFEVNYEEVTFEKVVNPELQNMVNEAVDTTTQEQPQVSPEAIEPQTETNNETTNN